MAASQHFDAGRAAFCACSSTSAAFAATSARRRSWLAWNSGALNVTLVAPAAGAADAGGAPAHVINLNTASAGELEELPGIGEARAKAIVAVREKRGGFKSVDVASIAPDNPNRAELRRKFLDEHFHKEDEVRFFVAGSGLFSLHLGDEVYEVLCQQGDLIGVG